MKPFTGCGRNGRTCCVEPGWHEWGKPAARTPIGKDAISKGGMEAFTRGFSEELADRKIRINCVAPGSVDTPMLWNDPNVKSGAEKIEGAIGQSADLAAAICFLAAPEARFITGTTLIADGGRLDIL